MSKNGTDSIGPYTEVALEWSIQQGATAVVTTGVRSYANVPDAKVLTQTFPSGLTPKNREGRLDEIVSAFPTFGQNHVDLGVLMYEGVQCQNTRFFRWPNGTRWGADDFDHGSKKADDDGSGMPLFLTTGDGSTIVMSPLKDFFTSAQTISTATGNFSFGMQGTVENVPKGHVHKTLIVGSSLGVR